MMAAIDDARAAMRQMNDDGERRRAMSPNADDNAVCYAMPMLVSAMGAMRWWSMLALLAADVDVGAADDVDAGADGGRRAGGRKRQPGAGVERCRASAGDGVSMMASVRAGNGTAGDDVDDVE